MLKYIYFCSILLTVLQWSHFVFAAVPTDEVRGVVLMGDQSPEEIIEDTTSLHTEGDELLVLDFDPSLLGFEPAGTPTTPNVSNEGIQEERLNIKRDKLLYESKRMRHYKYQSKLKREVVVPTSIEDLSLLANLDQLTNAEQNLFFVKKEAFLQKVARLGRLLRMSNKNINRLTHLFNKMMFTNAPLVVRSIRSKVMISLGVSVGIGFSDKILEKMKTMLRLSYIPDISGFYLMTSVGLTLHYVEKNGKKRWKFSSLNLENRWASEIYSPFVIAAGGLAVTYMNSTKVEDAPVEKGEIFHTSLANLNQSPTEYGVTSRLFTPLIPGGAIAVFKGPYANYRLSPLGFAELIKDSLRFLWPRRVGQCMQSLNLNGI